MDTLILSENNNQQHIEIAVDDIIQLQLDESPTTGYRWRIVNLDTHGIQVISEDFKINAHAGIGEAGKTHDSPKCLPNVGADVRATETGIFAGELGG